LESGISVKIKRQTPELSWARKLKLWTPIYKASVESNTQGGEKKLEKRFIRVLQVCDVQGG